MDYIRSLIARYKLQTCWEDDSWKEKVWKKVVVEQVEREGKRAWREEVEGRQDLGNDKDRQLVLDRADYIANSSGDKIRAEIKGKCEWGGGGTFLKFDLRIREVLGLVSLLEDEGR